MNLEANEAFRQFREGNWDDLDSRKIGKASALARANLNVHRVEELLPSLGRQIVDAAKTDPRSVLPADLDYGMSLTVTAAQTVNSALIVHLRSNIWYEHATLLVLRSALEMLGVAAVFAVGPRTEQNAYLEDRRISASNDGLPALYQILRVRRPNVEDPVFLYSWLSHHVHFTRKVLTGPRPAHETAYTALAFIAWACAVMAETLSGIEGLAEWPDDFPAGAPWLEDDSK